MLCLPYHLHKLLPGLVVALATVRSDFVDLFLEFAEHIRLLVFMISLHCLEFILPELILDTYNVGQLLSGQLQFDIHWP